MQTDTAAEYLIRRIRKQREGHMYTVAQGNVGSYEEYRRLVGVMQALSWVEALIDETAKKVANDEDLEEEWDFT